jgi:hypothetical protein
MRMEDEESVSFSVQALWFFRTRKVVHRYWKAGKMDKKGVS